MSTALIRGNMLTQLANRGESATVETERLVREFLADKPGAWMPEDFFAPYELVERSLDDAEQKGRHALLRTIHQLLSKLFVEVEARKLSETESRQLLSAMVIAGKHELLEGSKYPSVVEFVFRYPEIFWSRVTPIPDLVSDREQFVQLLLDKLPKEAQKRIRCRPTPDESLLEHIVYAFGHRPEKKILGRALLNGEIVEVEMVLNGESFRGGIIRINERCKALINATELLQFPAHAELSAINLGEVSIEVPSPRNIANVAFTRFNDSLETSMFPRR